MLKTKTKEATQKLLMFALQHLNVAIRLDDVVKVIPIPEIFRSGDKTLGLANFEDREVLVIDLSHEIFGTASTNPGRYLVVMQGDRQELFGVPVPGLPTMRDVAVSAVRPIPSDYRDRDALGIASHMVQVPSGEATQTAFLLSTDKLIEIVRRQSQS
jgi:purine-binding chemotaxis protein CheW